MPTTTLFFAMLVEIFTKVRHIGPDLGTLLGGW